MTEQTRRTRKEIEASMIGQAWKSDAYKQELLNNPKATVGKEFGMQVPDSVNVQILEETSSSLYFVLPMNPDRTGELSETQLEAVAGGEFSISLEGAADLFATSYDKGKDFGKSIW